MKSESDMDVNIEKIYRVVCDDFGHQITEPETHWTTSKDECKKYIQSCYYKHCLRIEEATLTDKILKIRI